jgi:putative selenium metabolism hydrolase
MINFLKDIVGIPSVSGEEKKVADRLSEEFEKLGYDEVIRIEGNVCGRRGNGPVTVLYDAHMDVVEPGAGWEGNPFEARVVDGFMYGRGSCDDKGSLAAIIHGGIRADIEGVTLYVLGSVREEVSEGNGLKDQKTGVKPDFVIIAEPSSLRVAYGNRGRVGINVEVRGKAGHASNPEAGDNAIYKAVGIVERIKKLNESLDDDSVAVTKIETSNKNINIIPETCCIYCDYRAGVGAEEAAIIDRIETCVKGAGVIKKTTPFYRPWRIEKQHLLVEAARNCMKEVLSKDELIMWNFCTNGSFTAGELDIPTVGFGPGSESEAHSAEEKIELDAVGKAADFYAALPQYIIKEMSG